VAPPDAPRNSFTVDEEASFTKMFTQEDVSLFASLTGDTNPIHFDDAYGQSTVFKGTIIHGALVVSLISTVLGTMLPGSGAIYLKQSVVFRAPARVNQRLTARVRIKAWDGVKGRILVDGQVVTDDGRSIITCEAELIMASFLK
jgi:3-hydroxybutyryl-CoA dehydratase